jgi:hypothetical protein
MLSGISAAAAAELVIQLRAGSHLVHRGAAQS